VQGLFSFKLLSFCFSGFFGSLIQAAFKDITKNEEISPLQIEFGLSLD
jgi:hypothetical protein